MGRHMIAREGVRTRLGYGLVPGALQFEADSKFPVVWQFIFDHPGKVLGHATNLERDEAGQITAEIVWNSTTGAKLTQELIDTELFATIFANGLVQRGKHVLSCDLKAISIGIEKDLWEGPPLKFEEDTSNNGTVPPSGGGL